MFRGLMLAEQSTPTIPMSKVIAHELEILGSHGMQAHRYDALFAMIETGKLARKAHRQDDHAGTVR
jgi:alcohol dehydrogenase